MYKFNFENMSNQMDPFNIYKKIISTKNILIKWSFEFSQNENLQCIHHKYEFYNIKRKYPLKLFKKALVNHQNFFN